MPDPASPKTYRIRRAASYRVRTGSVNPCTERKVRKLRQFRHHLETSGENSRSHPYASLVLPDAFAPGGALAATLPGYEARPEQAALAQAVELALGTGEHLLAEAGTGTGKSLAYLIPALESGQAVVVATATKALQEQLLAKDVPAAATALGREVRVAVLKGRQNYLCRKQLQSFGPMLLRDPRDEAAWEELQPWIAGARCFRRASRRRRGRGPPRPTS